MNINYDKYSRYEVPSLTLCHPDDTCIGIITNIENFKLDIKFNEVSTLSFKINQVSTVSDNALEDGVYNPTFDEIVERREILVEDLGYFIITDVNDVDDYAAGRYKEVSASSCEYELNYINMPYISGTYPLYSHDNWNNGVLTESAAYYEPSVGVTAHTVGTFYVIEDGEYTEVYLNGGGADNSFSNKKTYYTKNEYASVNCLLYEIMACLPHWTLVQSASSGIASDEEKYVELAAELRTYSSDDTQTIYSFIKNSLQSDYECFVKFDIMNRTIEVLTYDDALVDTDFVISEANGLNKCTIKTTIDDYTNALYVTSSDSSVNVQSVNPLGTATIYNFDHDISSGFIDPDSDLGKALVDWKSATGASSVSFSGIDYDKWEDWCDDAEKLQGYLGGKFWFQVDANEPGALKVCNSYMEIGPSEEFPANGNNFVCYKDVTPYFSYKRVLNTPSQLSSSYYKLGDTGFVACSSGETPSSTTEYFTVVTDDIDDDTIETGVYVMRSDYKYVGKNVTTDGTTVVEFAYADADSTSVTSLSNYYKWSGVDFVATSSTSENTVFYEIKGATDTEVDESVDEMYHWLHTNKVSLSPAVYTEANVSGGFSSGVTYYEVDSDGDYSETEDETPSSSKTYYTATYGTFVDATDSLTEASYEIIANSGTYAYVDTNDEYGQIKLEDITPKAASYSPAQGGYTKFSYPSTTLGISAARILANRISYFLTDVRTDVDSAYTSLNGYEAQLVSLQNFDIVLASNPTEDEQTAYNIKVAAKQKQIEQVNQSIRSQRVTLAVAIEKRRMLENDYNAINATILSSSSGLSFEEYFKTWYELPANSSLGDGSTSTEKAKNLYGKLLRYIRQQSYNEENITIEDYMTTEQKLKQEQSLYDYCVNLLAKASMPTYEITIDIEDLPFIAGYDDYDGTATNTYIDIANQLNVGSVISVEVQSNRATRWSYSEDGVHEYDFDDLDGREVIDFNLIEIQIDYLTPSISLVFGNRINRSDPSDIFEELQTSTQSAASLVSSNYIEWGTAVEEVSALKAERSATLDATLNGIAVRNASLQDNVTIDSSGLRCMTQKLDSNNNWVNDYGIWMSNGVILFTEDGWNTSKMAVGRMVQSDGTVIYGFNGDAIMADTITADKFVTGSVSKGSNLLKDGSFEAFAYNDQGGIDNVTSSTITTYDTDSTYYWAKITGTEASLVLAIETDDAAHGNKCISLCPGSGSTNPSVASSSYVVYDNTNNIVKAYSTYGTSGEYVLTNNASQQSSNIDSVSINNNLICLSFNLETPSAWTDVVKSTYASATDDDSTYNIFSSDAAYKPAVVDVWISSLRYDLATADSTPDDWGTPDVYYTCSEFKGSYDAVSGTADATTIAANVSSANANDFAYIVDGSTYKKYTYNSDGTWTLSATYTTTPFLSVSQTYVAVPTDDSLPTYEANNYFKAVRGDYDFCYSTSTSTVNGKTKDATDVTYDTSTGNITIPFVPETGTLIKFTDAFVPHYAYVKNVTANSQNGFTVVLFDTANGTDVYDSFVVFKKDSDEDNFTYVSDSNYMNSYVIGDDGNIELTIKPLTVWDDVDVLVVSNSYIKADDKTNVSWESSYGYLELNYLPSIIMQTGGGQNNPYILSLYLKTSRGLSTGEYVEYSVGSNTTTTTNSEVRADTTENVSTNRFSEKVTSTGQGWKRFYTVGYAKGSSGDITIAKPVSIKVRLSAGNKLYIDGVLLENSGVLNDFSYMPGESFSKYTMIDDSGVHIHNGMLKIYNNAGATVLSGDSDGNLVMRGTVNASAGSNIAGWITNENGFYKEGQKYNPDDETELLYTYPTSGLFVGGTYGFDDDGYFDFDGTTYSFPMLFMGYDGELDDDDQPKPIDLNSVKFYVDETGKMKAVDATITGTYLSQQAKTISAPDGVTKNFSFTISGVDADVIVCVNGSIWPRISASETSTYGYKYSSSGTTGTISFDVAPSTGTTIQVYENSGYGASISYANITDALVGRAAIEDSVITSSSISSAVITNSTISDCIAEIERVRNYLVFEYDSMLEVPSDLITETNSYYTGYAKATTLDWNYYVSTAVSSTTDGVTSYEITQNSVTGTEYERVATIPAGYTWAGIRTYQLDEPYPTNIFVTVGGSPWPIYTTNPAITTIAGDGSTYSFSLGSSYPSNVLVTLDGVSLTKGTDFTYSSGVVTIITGYRLLSTAPSDFQTNYSNYYTYDSDEETYSALTEAVTFATNTYYKYVGAPSVGQSVVIYSGDGCRYSSTTGIVEFLTTPSSTSEVAIYDASEVVGISGTMRNILIDAKSITIRAEAEDGTYTVGDDDTAYTLGQKIYKVFSGFAKTFTEYNAAVLTGGFSAGWDYLEKNSDGTYTKTSDSSPISGKTYYVASVDGFDTVDVAVSMTKPIYLDGTVYVKGLKEYYRTNEEVDIVTAFNDVYQQIAINRTAIAMIGATSAMIDALEVAGIVGIGLMSAASLLVSLLALNRINGGGLESSSSSSSVIGNLGLHKFIACRIDSYKIISWAYDYGRESVIADVTPINKIFKFADMTPREDYTYTVSSLVYGSPNSAGEYSSISDVVSLADEDGTYKQYFSSVNDCYNAFTRTFYPGTNAMTMAGEDVFIDNGSQCFTISFEHGCEFRLGGVSHSTGWSSSQTRYDETLKGINPQTDALTGYISQVSLSNSMYYDYSSDAGLAGIWIGIRPYVSGFAATYVNRSTEPVFDIYQLRRNSLMPKDGSGYQTMCYLQRIGTFGEYPNTEYLIRGFGGRTGLGIFAFYGTSESLT